MLRWPDETIYGGLASVADAQPSATALVSPDGTTTNYAALLERSRDIAAGLSDVGVGAGDTVAVWLGNRREWVELQLAASYLGAAVVAVNTRYDVHELEHILEDAACRVLVTESTFADRDHLGIVAELGSDLTTGSDGRSNTDQFPTLDAVVAVGDSDGYPGVRPYESLVDPGTTAPSRARDPTRPACVFYTSGTTGEPKGCLQTSRSLLNHSHAVGEFFDVSGDDVALGALPFCGVMGYNAFLSALTHGLPIVLQHRFEPGRVLEAIETHGVTYFSAIGEMYRRLVDHEEFDPERVETLSRGAVAFVNGFEDETFERIEAAVGFPLVQPYGLSEANSQVFVGDPDAPLSARKRVGGPLVHPAEEDAKIVDPETGEELPPGEGGELCLRGYNVMTGYLGRPEATEEAIHDGWLHTGDLCHRDENGAFVFRSRLDDALRVRGFLVSPRDIENPIESHPDVEAVAVVGASHDRHGQVPVAFVVGGDSLDEPAVRSYLADRIADYKIPERVVFVDSLPRTEGPHGAKIQKAPLRERATELFE